ncbi:FliH/SctL family protein [Aquabacterium humicola]|uniref:FliH/SctL family protein n=1 Tax=Aquabacterium humicola TaxID=3237377 RepID=UPI002542B151|nr:FliH/SctL family protein [Rubrivivax pictus]
MALILRVPSSATGKTLVPTRPLAEAGVDAMEPQVGADVAEATDPIDEALQRAIERGHAEGVEQGRRAGFERGIEEGRAEGLKRGGTEGREALQAAAERLCDLADELARARAAALQQAEDDIVCIAFEALCKLVGDHLVTAEGVAAHVRNVIERVAEPRGIRVRVNPQDLALLNDHPQAHRPGESLEWCADASLACGGCVVESAAGEFRARLDEQLRQVLGLLQDARTRSAAEADATARLTAKSLPTQAPRLSTAPVPAAEVRVEPTAGPTPQKPPVSESAAGKPAPKVFSMKWGVA